TARLFVDYEIQHPLLMALFLVLTAVTFCLFGFIIGIWADGWEKLQIVPSLIVMPLAFLGGSFYSIEMLPPLWQKITLFNPVVYLSSGCRWSLYGVSDIGVGVSLAMIFGFLVLCLGLVWWIFRTGYRLENCSTGACLFRWRKTSPLSGETAVRKGCHRRRHPF